MANDDQRERDKVLMDEHGLAESTLYDMKEGFAMFAKDDGSVLPVQEVGTVMRAINQNPTEADVKEMINDAEVDEDGNIQFEEFVRLTATKLKSDDEKTTELEEALKVFDKLGQGLIDVSEITNALRTLGEPIDEDDINEMIKLGEKDKNNQISLYDLAGKILAK